MTDHVFLFLLVVCLLLSLALLWRLCWLLLQPSHFKAGAVRTTVHRLRHRHVPRTIAPLVDWSPLPRWVQDQDLLRYAAFREVKSRRGAPKRINTQGYACPNPKCSSFANTDAQVHALVGDGKHGHAERIQTFRCQACRTTFTSRHNTALYRLKTPSHRVAVVLSALAEGLDPSAAERAFGYRQATIITWLTRAGKHAETFHERCFRNLHLPHLQLDEIRTRLRRSTQVLWLWLAIDPLTKSFPSSSSVHVHRHGPSAHPLPATAFGRLSASHSLPVTD